MLLVGATKEYAFCQDSTVRRGHDQPHFVHEKRMNTLYHNRLQILPLGNQLPWFMSANQEAEFADDYGNDENVFLTLSDP